MSNVSEKSRLATLLLCWFLGVFGAHRFYAGKTGTAIVMLVLTCTVVGLLVTGIWMFIDLIMTAAGSFKDGQGRQIKTW